MNKILTLTIAIAILMLSACSVPMIHMYKYGEIQVRTESPDLSTVPSYYKIHGTHDGDLTFDQTSTGTSIQIEDLAPGVWQLTVEAYNDTDQLIGEGTGTLTVEPGGTTSIVIVLYDTTGSGSLDFSLSWNPDLISQASLVLTMTTLGGQATDVTYTLSSGSASGLTESLASGFYILNVQLLDGDTVVMGSTETVLIRDGAVTTVDLNYSDINKPGERLVKTGSGFTISWDCTGTDIDNYNVYYRTHGTWSWIYLGSTGSGSVMSFSVDTTILDYGVYDFAVSSVAGSAESELHTSMDDTAIPSTGWYVDWSS